jgi:hypothetical protein
MIPIALRASDAVMLFIMIASIMALVTAGVALVASVGGAI